MNTDVSLRLMEVVGDCRDDCGVRLPVGGSSANTNDKCGHRPDVILDGLHPIAVASTRGNVRDVVHASRLANGASFGTGGLWLT